MPNIDTFFWARQYSHELHTHNHKKIEKLQKRILKFLMIQDEEARYQLLEEPMINIMLNHQENKMNIRTYLNL